MVQYRPMEIKYRLIVIVLGMLGTNAAANAQISIAVNPDGTTTASLAGQMSVPKGLASMFATIDNKTFTCSLVSPVKGWVQNRAKDGDVLAAMVSSGRAISMDREAGYPIMAMINGSDGDHRILMPGVLKFKIDIKPGAPLHADGYDIEAKRAIKAGDELPVLYINGPVILSVEALQETLAKPLVSIFRADSKGRNATIGVWRIETNLR